MLLKKSGFPDEDEMVLCTVTAIHYHSVFVSLDEYNHQGMIHISEISPGRIRNIRDYVKEGKKIVCKVLRVHKDKGHIDLSLRRVNESQKKEKVSEIKQEQLAENIVLYVAKQRKVKVEDLYKQITEKIFKDYDNLYPAFEDAAFGNESLEKMGIDKKLAAELMEVISQRIKPVEIEIGGQLMLSSYEPKGVEIIKDAITKSITENAEIKYKGAGAYTVKVKSLEYKDAEKELKKLITGIEDYMESHNSEAEFIREER